VKAHPSLYHKRAFSIVALSKFKEVTTHSAFRQRLALFLILFSVSERTISWCPCFILYMKRRKEKRNNWIEEHEYTNGLPHFHI
jgi:hypothetical protein